MTGWWLGTMELYDFVFFYILGITIPTDEVIIFQRGWIHIEHDFLLGKSINVVKAMSYTTPFVDVLYHPLIVIWGMVDYCFNHIIVIRKSFVIPWIWISYPVFCCLSTTIPHQLHYPEMLWWHPQKSPWRKGCSYSPTGCWILESQRYVSNRWDEGNHQNMSQSWFQKSL